ncbi:MAG: hypothetical protein WAK41_03170 [Roseiarcus sp.]
MSTDAEIEKLMTIAAQTDSKALLRRLRLGSATAATCLPTRPVSCCRRS